MGCDIHLHIEVNIHGQWMHHSCPRIKRNYTLFGMMAGVRTDEEGLFGPAKGLPEDVTPLTLFDYNLWKEDGHTESWLSSKEVQKLIDVYLSEVPENDRFFWESSQFGLCFGNDWSSFHKFPDDRPPGLDNFRFVFWFDN